MQTRMPVEWTRGAILKAVRRNVSRAAKGKRRHGWDIGSMRNVRYSCFEQ